MNNSVSVLIVEDSLTQAAQLERILKGCGYDVLKASNGAEALDILRTGTESPTLVLTDVIMPQMDGYALCAWIKAEERLKHLPVILLTTLSDPKDVIKGLQCGADSFIVKPYEETVLLARIRYVLANQELRKNTGSQMGIEIVFAGQKYVIKSERIQMIDLLLSTYETAVQKSLALSRAKEEAERANREKSEFLSRMSHELRTPLNAILGFAQILELELKEPRDQESVAHILHAGRHLLDLITEVLDISRIEAGRLNISLEPVRLSEVLDQCIELIQPIAQQRRVSLLGKYKDKADQHIVADRQRLNQVMLNLLSNAVKFNRDGGTVTLLCEQPDHRVRISVTDTGPGISAGNREKLFSTFERLEADHAGIEGSGLGLALSKKLTELMGGRIGVESTLGAGSVFWVEFPLAADPMEDHPRLAEPPAAMANRAPLNVNGIYK